MTTLLLSLDWTHRWLGSAWFQTARSVAILQHIASILLVVWPLERFKIIHLKNLDSTMWMWPPFCFFCIIGWAVPNFKSKGASQPCSTELASYRWSGLPWPREPENSRRIHLQNIQKLALYHVTTFLLSLPDLRQGWLSSAWFRSPISVTAL